MTNDIPWIIWFRKNNHARASLFCFHHGGGSATFFRKWIAFFDEDIDLAAVQMPGRDNRFLEPFTVDLNIATSKIVDEILSQQKPFVFFGHSLGALVAYEVVLKLQNYGARLPDSLIVSAKEAPHLKLDDENMRSLSDVEFIEVFRKFGGMPEEVCNNIELMQLLLPRLRADIFLSETYKFSNQPLLSIPIIALGGATDPYVKRENLLAWGELTDNEFYSQIFPGDHFYINNNIDDVINIVKESFFKNFRVIKRTFYERKDF